MPLPLVIAVEEDVSGECGNMLLFTMIPLEGQPLASKPAGPSPRAMCGRKGKAFCRFCSLPSLLLIAIASACRHCFCLSPSVVLVAIASACRHCFCSLPLAVPHSYQQLIVVTGDYIASIAALVVAAALYKLDNDIHFQLLYITLMPITSFPPIGVLSIARQVFGPDFVDARFGAYIGEWIDWM
jgi:hypothetical protein